MNRSFHCCISNLILLSSISLFSATGEVVVTIESTTDLSSWPVETPVAKGVQSISTSPTYFRAKIIPIDGGDPSYSNVETASLSSPEFNVNISLESSDDLSNWSDAAQDTDAATYTVDITGSKQFWRVNVRSIYNDLVTIQGATILTEPSISVDTFKIGRYEVSKEQWDTVYDWAINDSVNVYDFFVGLAGSNGVGNGPNYPVTKISWYDAAKWCNALSEMEGLTPVYYTDTGLTSVYREGNVIIKEANVSGAADGYRLPYAIEWRFAARGGPNSPDYLYSGSSTIADVAVFDDISNKPLASKSPNFLGIYDMSGNIAEYVNDDEGDNGIDKNVRALGGFTDDPFYFPPTFDNFRVNASGHSSQALVFGDDSGFGFRIVQNVPNVVFSTVEAANIPSGEVSKPDTKILPRKKPKKVK